MNNMPRFPEYGVYGFETGSAAAAAIPQKE